MKDSIEIAKLSTLVDSRPIARQVDSVELLIIKNNGGVSVFQGKCPHEAAPLSQGSVDNGILTCASHGWRFHCVTGANEESGRGCLKRFQTRIEGDVLCVSRAEVRAWKQSQSGTAGASTLEIHDLPGPKGIPIFGNLFQTRRQNFHQTLVRWGESYGSRYRFQMGNRKFVMFSNPEVIHEMLRDRPDTFRRVRIIESMFREVGIEGLFSAEGEMWRRHRSLTTPAFNTAHLQQFFGTLLEVTERLKRRWQKTGGPGRELEVQKDLMRFTVDVTTNLAFGYDMNTLEKEGDVIQRHLEKIFPILGKRLNAPFPYWRYIKFPEDIAVERSFEEIRKAVEQFIFLCRKRMEENPELRKHPTNFLEGLLASEEAGSKLSDTELFGNVITILVAGEDTTANAIAWMMHFMVQHPEVQRKMREEALSVLGPAGPMSYADADRLPYIEAVAHESMRLKPVAPFLFLEPLREVVLDGVRIPAGYRVGALSLLCSNQEQHFSRPKEFIPERWIASQRPSDFNHNPKAFLPFGAGARYCPGRALAMLEIKTVMAMLCRHFWLERPKSGRTVQEEFAFVTVPNNLWMEVRS